MAIHAVCEFCGYRLSVPDDMKGKKVTCPTCDKKTRVLTELELSIENARRKHEASAAAEPAEKSEAASKKQRLGTVMPGGAAQPGPPASQSASPQAPPPVGTVREPAAISSRYQSLRALGAVFTFLAYLLGASGVAAGIILFANDGTEGGLLKLLALFVGSVIALSLFKLLSDLARLGADIGDTELKMLHLLVELRESLDKLKK